VGPKAIVGNIDITGKNGHESPSNCNKAYLKTLSRYQTIIQLYITATNSRTRASKTLEIT
jgi:hypothetical protein